MSGAAVKVMRQPGYGLVLLRTKVARPRTTVALEELFDATSPPDSCTSPRIEPEQVLESVLELLAPRALRGDPAPVP